MTLDHANLESDIELEGAVQIGSGPFEAGTNFVDLHLDFPVAFDAYVVGRTPFLSAAMHIGFENMQLHSLRMQYLNQLIDHKRGIKNILTLYAKGKIELFSDKVLAFIDAEMDCDTPLDQNRALYLAIERAFFPFAEPERNLDAVRLYTSELESLSTGHRSSLHAFLNEIVESEFLKNVQIDCLEIYPRILDIELMLRAALFLDFDQGYAESQVPYRVSALEFQDAKDLYKDILEIISRATVLVGGINNLKKRGNHNAFLNRQKGPKSLEEFAKLPLGRRLEFIDDSWYPYVENVLDNQLRNSVAHYNAEYDEITQVITYYPKKEGMKRTKSETLSFLDFSRRVLSAFRELHRMNHLTKCLFVFYYINIKGVKSTPFGN
ncbi:MAG: hypothetical protein ACTSV9_07295 [Candidatus Thorarchaeota archaeon]